MNAVIVPVLPNIALRRILFTTDFTEASSVALPVVSAIARRYGAKVFGGYVWSHGPYTLVAPEAVAALDRQTDLESRATMAKLLQSQAFAGIETEAVVRCGIAPQEIGRLVDQYAIDLVVMSTHGRTGFRHRVLGSVTEEAVRTLRCPVLTVGPHLAGRFARPEGIKEILFPTDLSEASLAVFPYLASLAHEYQSRLTVLHILPSDTPERPQGAYLKHSLCEWMKKTLSNEISPRTTAEYNVASGPVAETILVHAQRRHADLIGLGVRHARDLAKRFRETLAYRVLADSECPVLTARLA